MCCVEMIYAPGRTELVVHNSSSLVVLCGLKPMHCLFLYFSVYYFEIVVSWYLKLESMKLGLGWLVPVSSVSVMHQALLRRLCA